MYIDKGATFCLRKKTLLCLSSPFAIFLSVRCPCLGVLCPNSMPSSNLFRSGWFASDSALPAYYLKFRISNHNSRYREKHSLCLQIRKLQYMKFLDDIKGFLNLSHMVQTEILASLSLIETHVTWPTNTIFHPKNHAGMGSAAEDTVPAGPDRAETSLSLPNNLEHPNWRLNTHLHQKKMANCDHRKRNVFSRWGLRGGERGSINCAKITYVLSLHETLTTYINISKVEKLFISCLPKNLIPMPLRRTPMAALTHTVVVSEFVHVSFRFVESVPAVSLL